MEVEFVLWAAADCCDSCDTVDMERDLSRGDTPSSDISCVVASSIPLR